MYCMPTAHLSTGCGQSYGNPWFREYSSYEAWLIAREIGKGEKKINILFNMHIFIYCYVYVVLAV